MGKNATLEEENLESYSRIPQSDLQTAFLSLATQTHAILTRRGWGNIRNEKTGKWEGREREQDSNDRKGRNTFVERAVTDREKAIATTVRACVFGLSYCCRAARVDAVHCAGFRGNF